MDENWTKMNHILLYGNYEKVFQRFPMADVGRLVIGMLHYLNTGVDFSPKGRLQYIWPVFKDQIDRNIEKYEKVCERNRNNAQKYWDSRKTEEENAIGTQTD